MAKRRAETMGERLQRLRLAAGFSQSQLAGKSGVPIGTLRNWEQDRREPLLGTAARVAQALAVSLDVLAGLSVEAPPPPAEPAGEKRKGRKKGE
jgi:transcriptional regulator with XRE-family HTH domain